MSSIIKIFILFFIISGTFLAWFPDVHTALILSLGWTVFLLYKYGYNAVNTYLNSGISEISNEISSLNKQQKLLEEQVNALTNDIIKSRNYFEDAVNKAHEEAKALMQKRKTENTEFLTKQQQKKRQLFTSIENEYSQLIKERLTALIIARLTSKIQNAENVKDITLTDINRALEAVSTIQSNI